jgi:hypothetical protein
MLQYFPLSLLEHRDSIAQKPVAAGSLAEPGDFSCMALPLISAGRASVMRTNAEPWHEVVNSELVF